MAWQGMLLMQTGYVLSPSCVCRQAQQQGSAQLELNGQKPGDATASPKI